MKDFGYFFFSSARLLHCWDWDSFGFVLPYFWWIYVYLHTQWWRLGCELQQVKLPLPSPVSGSRPSLLGVPVPTSLPTPPPSRGVWPGLPVPVARRGAQLRDPRDLRGSGTATRPPRQRAATTGMCSIWERWHDLFSWVLPALLSVYFCLSFPLIILLVRYFKCLNKNNVKGFLLGYVCQQ